jgi:tetratricopeptide (TPR) repeat protein
MLAALLLAVVALLYSPVAGFPFLQLDDNPRLLQQDLAKAGAGWAFNNGFAWQPATWLSHQAAFRLFGFQSAGNHHLVNLLLHLANTGLLFWFLAKLTGERIPGLIAAGLFAVHPLRVESVAWVSGRGDLLAALFVLLALEAYRREKRWMVIPLATLAMLASPAAAPIALVLYLLDRLFLERSPDPRVMVPLAFLGAVALTLRATGGPDHDTLLPAKALIPGLGGLAGQILSAFWPAGLSIARVPGGNSLVTIALALALGALLTGAVWLGRNPVAKLGAAWFILLLSPSLLLPSVWGYADHQSYLPHLGLVMALVWAIPTSWRPLAGKVALVVLLAAAALSWVHLHHFQGTVPLLQQVLTVDPSNDEARLGLGLALAGQSSFVAAENHLAMVTRTRPDSALAWVGYGRALTSQRKAVEALAVMDQAVSKVPQSADARFERGIALQNVNRLAEAEQSFIEALNLGLDPRSGAIAYNNLGTYAAQRNEIQKAEKYFEQAFTLDLGFALAHRNYAMTLVAQKQRQKAIDHLQRKAVLWTNNDRLVGEYLAAIMTEAYGEQYKKEQEQMALEQAAEMKALEEKQKSKK